MSPFQSSITSMVCKALLIQVLPSSCPGEGRVASGYCRTLWKGEQKKRWYCRATKMTLLPFCQFFAATFIWNNLTGFGMKSSVNGMNGRTMLWASCLQVAAGPSDLTHVATIVTWLHLSRILLCVIVCWHWKDQVRAEMMKLLEDISFLKRSCLFSFLFLQSCVQYNWSCLSGGAGTMPSEAADTHAGLPAGLDPFGSLATLSCSPFSPTAIRRKRGKSGSIRWQQKFASRENYDIRCWKRQESANISSSCNTCETPTRLGTFGAWWRWFCCFHALHFLPFWFSGGHATLGGH